MLFEKIEKRKCLKIYLIIKVKWNHVLFIVMDIPHKVNDVRIIVQLRKRDLIVENIRNMHCMTNKMMILLFQMMLRLNMRKIQVMNNTKRMMVMHNKSRKVKKNLIKFIIQKRGNGMWLKMKKSMVSKGNMMMLLCLYLICANHQ